MHGMPSILLAAPLLTRSASILYLWNRPLSIAPRTSHTHRHRHQRLCPSEPSAVCAAASSESVYRAVDFNQAPERDNFGTQSFSHLDGRLQRLPTAPFSCCLRTPLKATSNQQCTRSESASYDRARIATLLLRLGLGRLVQHSTQRTTCFPTCDSTGGGPQTRPRRLRINPRLRLSTAINSRP